MKFSVKIQYGLQAMLELALNYGSGTIQIKDIAENQNIPIRFLEQLLLVLKRRELVISSRGKKGGYSLARNPQKVTALEIIEAFEGPMELAPKRLKRKPVLYEALEQIQRKIQGDLGSLTLEDLAFRERKKGKMLIYSI